MNGEGVGREIMLLPFSVLSRYWYGHKGPHINEQTNTMTMTVHNKLY